MDIILASTSVFRRQILQKLCIPFRCIAPQTDETRLANETPAELVKRLAKAKAQAVADSHPNSWVIGSDQVAVLGHQVLGKPGNAVTAQSQLRQCSGRTVTFLTGLCLIPPNQDQGEAIVEPFDVTFKTLSAKHISTYIQLENPIHCAGSFKSEGLGISLFEKLQGDDPNTLIGLPLIRLIALFENAGLDIFDLMVKPSQE